jgi:hypothetical protein
MKKALSILILILASIRLSYAQEPKPFPAALVQQLQHYDYKTIPNEIVVSVYKAIFPDSTFNEPESGVLTAISVDLDGDLSPEILALVGLNEYETNIILLKKTNKGWYLIFTQPVNEFYEHPELHIINNVSRNKVFYTRQLYDRGSGVFRETYQFFKLINGKVYKCLELINSAHISGWDLPLNQEVSSRIVFSSSSADEAWVTFNYNFFSSLSLLSDSVKDNEDFEVSFARGEEGVLYQWDSASYCYKPKLYSNPKSLTQYKIDCFGNFGNDSLFVQAFKPELSEMLDKGTKKEKSLLRLYLRHYLSSEKTKAQKKKQ